MGEMTQTKQFKANQRQVQRPRERKKRKHLISATMKKIRNRMKQNPTK